jgi:hypothetical protein
MQHWTWKQKRRSIRKFTARREKKTKGNQEEGLLAFSEPLVADKIAYEKAKQAVDAVKLTATTEGAKAFKLYGSLSSDETRQPWEKIFQAQMTKCLWENIYGVTHDETPTKTWDSFM